MSKAFLDSNVIVYANDISDEAKHERAIDLVASLMRSGEGVVSTQVQMEYAAVAVRKLAQPSSAVRRQLVLLDRLEVVPVSRDLIEHGIELIDAYGISFWDGVILAAATAARCEVLWSEDFAHDRRYGQVTVRNPFRA